METQLHKMIRENEERHKRFLKARQEQEAMFQLETLKARFAVLQAFQESLAKASKYPPDAKISIAV